MVCGEADRGGDDLLWAGAGKKGLRSGGAAGPEKGNPEDLVGPRGGKSPWWRRRELNPRPWTADLQRTTCLASLDFLRSCDRPTWNSFA